MSTTLIINLWPSSQTMGHSRAIKSFVDQELGEHASVYDSAHFGHMSSEETADILISLIRLNEPNYVLLIGSTSSIILDAESFDRVNGELVGRTVLYWEPDGWGRGKPVTETMKKWFYRADVLLHVGGVKDLSSYVSPTTLVGLAPHTYCHLLFAQEEMHPPERETQSKSVMIANNVTRSKIPIPGVTGLSGSYSRWDLARRAKKSLGREEFQLYGSGWPQNWSTGMVPFGDQVSSIRESRISIIWDHYLNLPEYVSDRFVYALLAGRAHLMAQGSRLSWPPYSELSVLSGSSPSEMICIMNDFLSNTDEKIYDMGIRNWEWVRHRLSARQFAQYALAQMRTDVTVPNIKPWKDLKIGVQGEPNA